jgi:hypothetical protein
VDARQPGVLHCRHVFDHRGDALAHAGHVLLRDAVLLLPLRLTQPAPARRARVARTGDPP